MWVKICYIIAFVAEGFTAWKYFSCFFEKRKKKPMRTISWFLIAYFFLFMISMLNLINLNLVAFIVVNLCLSCLLYKMNFGTSIMHVGLLTVIMQLTEFIPLSILRNIYADTYAYIKGPAQLIILTTISKISFYFIVWGLGFIFGLKKDIFGKNQDKIVVCLNFVPVISICMFLIFFTMYFSGTLTKFYVVIMIVISLLILLINIIMFSVYDYRQKISREYLDLQFQLQRETANTEYYKMLSEKNESQNIMIHDMKKHLNVIYELNREENRQRIGEYIERLINSKGLKKSVQLSENIVLNVILERYRQICEENQIDYASDIRSETVENLPPEDLTALFGNLLENAVENSQGSGETAFVELTVKRMKDQVFIILINSCRKRPGQDKKGVFQSGKKDGKHGFGLKSIEKVAKKYNGDVEMYYREETHTFHSIIVLNKI